MRRLPLLFAPVLLLSFAGCARKAPKTAVATPPPAPAQEVTAPASGAGSDPVEAGLPAELEALNAEVARRGLLGDVYFAYDEATLDEAARERLARNARFLADHPEYLVTVEGHCDERGTNEYNLALGNRRSGGARDYLTSLGVAGARLAALSYGEERPQCVANEEPCWSRNRRARFLITGRTGS